MSFIHDEGHISLCHHLLEIGAQSLTEWGQVIWNELIKKVCRSILMERLNKSVLSMFLLFHSHWVCLWKEKEEEDLFTFLLWHWDLTLPIFAFTCHFKLLVFHFQYTEFSNDDICILIIVTLLLYSGNAKSKKQVLSSFTDLTKVCSSLRSLHCLSNVEIICLWIGDLYSSFLCLVMLII